MINKKKDLALAHQIISLWKMDDATYTHLSIKEREVFYLSPFGLLFEEVAENNLVTIDLKSLSIASDSNFSIYNPTGLILHSIIYKLREDIQAVIHLHTSATIVVSASKSGLLPISQHALHFYNSISYHDYDSLVLDEIEQAKKIVEDLKENNVIFLRNHGFVTCGKTIQEALFYAYHLERACHVQVLLNQPLDHYILPDEKVCIQAYNELLSFEKDLGRRDWDAWIRKLR